MRTRNKQIWLYVEFVFLFFGIPLLIYLDEEFIHPSIIILPVLVFVFLLLRRNTEFNWREIFHWKISSKILGMHAIILLVMTLGMLLFVYFFHREQLFNLPRANPLIYLAMCIFYPVFSAFGQEIIYRTFLSRRYGAIFPEAWHFVLASGITFSFLHVVYYDPVSMILTLVGGLYFAKVYLDTRSVLLTSVLHGLYGIVIFGVGLGEYFWLDIATYL